MLLYCPWKRSTIILSFHFIYPFQLKYTSFTSSGLLLPFQSGFSMYSFLRTWLRSLCSPSRSKATNFWVLYCWYPKNYGAKRNNTDLNSHNEYKVPWEVLDQMHCSTSKSIHILLLFIKIFHIILSNQYSTHFLNCKVLCALWVIFLSMDVLKWDHADDNCDSFGVNNLNAICAKILA